MWIAKRTGPYELALVHMDFRTKVLQGEEIFSTDENDGDRGIFSAELKDPKSLTGES